PAGEGGPRVSEGRERGAPFPETELPSPPLLRRVPSPAEGGGKTRVAARTILTMPPPRDAAHARRAASARPG
ncbi:hypothetical protein FV227_24980, partial [Methylobacterium sp. WL119]